MKNARRKRSPLRLFLLTAVALLLFNTACADLYLTPEPSATAYPSALPPTATVTRTPTPTLPATLTLTPTPGGPLPTWGRFAGPAAGSTPATPIPPPMPPAALPDEVHAILLAGLDRDDPYRGRSDAMLLLLYQPRLAKAALVSIPPDLFGYLPGQTMQRLSSAYPLGGAELMRQAVEYNLGVRADSYIVIHLDDFALLVDELGGLDVPVMQDLPGQCGDVLIQGEQHMDGALALCYARLRDGPDEAARGLRQQELLRLLLDRLVQNGNLARLPELFSLFRSRVDTNLTAADALTAIPVALRLGDPSRTAYFLIGADQTDLWQISTQPPASVFLPRREAIRATIKDALDFVSKPSPLSDVVLTYEVQLTASPSPTGGTPFIMPSPLPRKSSTPGPTATAPTSTRTPTLTPTPSPTATYSP
jgi:polyisoprenyl-teichoic acid--peptidoglycan teichoic acid transferase